MIRFQPWVLLAAAVVAGCGNSAAPAASAPSPSPTSQFVVPTPVPATPTVDPATPTPTPDPPFKVGILVPLSGPLAGRGGDHLDGFRLGLQSVAGRTVEPVPIDTQTSTEALFGSIQSHPLDLLMGLDGGTECRAVAEYAERQHLPLAITGDCPIEAVTGDYTARFTHLPSGEGDAAADWAAKNHDMSATLLTSDDQDGLEMGDAFASAFVARGGRIVQELHPAPGAAVAVDQLNLGADLLVLSLPAEDATRLASQLSTQTAAKKPVLLDVGARVTTGPALAQLGDKALGVVSVSDYLSNLDSPPNQAFLAAWRGTYGSDRPLSNDAAAGYVGAQLLNEALSTAHGRAEDSQLLLQTLYFSNLETIKGPLKLDGQHDVVESIYVRQLVKQGSGYSNKLLQTYVGVGRTWDRTPEALAAFRFGSYKGTWVGMTKDKLGGAVSERSLFQYWGVSPKCAGCS